MLTPEQCWQTELCFSLYRQGARLRQKTDNAVLKEIFARRCQENLDYVF